MNSSCLCENPEDSTVVLRKTVGGRETRIVRCRHCGLHRTDPRPEIELLKANSYQSVSGFEQQLKETDKFRRFAGRILSRAASYISPKIGTLLDVGCGAGSLLLEARDAGWTCMGLELNALAGEHARSLGLSVLTGSLEERAADLETFDVITLSQVLEHLDSPTHAIASLTKLLKPGGVLIIESPNLFGLYPRILGARWYGFAFDQHLWHFTPPAMSMLARRADVRLEAVSAGGCLDYGLPIDYCWITDLPGKVGLGDNLIAVFKAS